MAAVAHRARARIGYLDVGLQLQRWQVGIGDGGGDSGRVIRHRFVRSRTSVVAHQPDGECFAIVGQGVIDRCRTEGAANGGRGRDALGVVAIAGAAIVGEAHLYRASWWLVGGQHIAEGIDRLDHIVRTGLAFFVDRRGCRDDVALCIRCKQLEGVGAIVVIGRRRIVLIVVRLVEDRRRHFGRIVKNGFRAAVTANKGHHESFAVVSQNIVGCGRRENFANLGTAHRTRVVFSLGCIVVKPDAHCSTRLPT